MESLCICTARTVWTISLARIDSTMADARDSSRKLICCSICLETLKSPKSQTCMHTFCEKCICNHASDLSKEGAQPTTCPLCRSLIPIPITKENPEEWAAKLPNNSVVLSPSASTRVDMNVPVYCEPCASVKEHHISVAFCVTCSEYLCQTCYNCHNRFKMSRDHEINAHAILEQTISNSLNDTMYKCQNHNRELTYFCSEHRELCCIKCALQDHQTCEELVYVEDRLSDVTGMLENVKQALQNLDVLRKMFILLTRNRETTLETIQQQKLDVIKSIKDWTNLIKGRVDKFETATMQELEQICKNKMIKISDQVVKCKRSIATIETSQAMIVESKRSDDRCKIFVTMTKVSQQLLKYVQQYDLIERTCKEIKITFQRNQNMQMVQNEYSLGRVSSKVSNIPRLRHAFQFEGIFMMPCVQLNSVGTLNVETLSDKNACNITSGACLPDKTFVLYDDGNGKIKLFDKHFHFLSHLDLYIRSNICVLDRSTVAIAAGSRIHLLSVTDSLQQVKSIDYVEACYGLASYQQNLIVYTCSDRILTYNASYEVTKIIQSFKSCNRRQISMTTAGQNIYCAVRDKIITIDMNDETLEAFEVDDLKDVVAIAADKNGIIYCCGQESSNVVLFSPEGRQLGALLSREHGLENPTGICLNNSNSKLFVFQSMSSKVKVFTLF